MIVSHAHQFIFLKTRKTAGTSLEIGLSAYCGPNDIITPISKEDERIRAELANRGPQNFRVSLPFVPWIKTPLSNHSTAAKVRRSVRRGTWERFFKFSIERNPFDKALSRYWWGTRAMDPRPGISEFLASCPTYLLSNWDIYSIGGKVAADSVVRFEYLDAELREIEKRLNIGPITMVRAKSSHRKDRRHYREILSASDRQLIERVCAREIEHFGYRW